MAYIFLG
jgi:hypothetical protein